MKHILTSFLLFAGVLTSLSGVAQTKFLNTSWDEVKKTAQKENKLIFVDLYFTGCFPCAQMDKMVFPDPKVSKILNDSYVSFKSDIFKEEIGKKLARKYGVTGFPSFIILDQKGRTIEVVSGFHAIDEFVELLELTKTKAAKREFKSYSKDLEGDYPEFYNDAYLNNNRKMSFEIVDSYLKTQKDLSDEIPFVVIKGLRVGGVYADYVIKNAKELSGKYGKMPVRNYLASIVNIRAKQFSAEDNRTAFNKLLEQVKQMFNHEEWSRFMPGFEKTYKKYAEQ
ncbi:thioredoxin family protein [Aestuariibaculum sediminum]|uniref:Thioredoxin family protein n=1 Tax=Aestuariibaculum sediminum TaxID=2770637 RepID=A0A8J6Q2A1_9FLAO|nr:thioredoxin family protein [Aestuariibaculum sediminum]MBD0833452.1 thioredoxin family protein [Aestuariibaculum sediminum]